MSTSIRSTVYHHGDLRIAALKAALTLLATRDLESVGLREIARAVGVSATALYRHFPDKAALHAALAEHGFIQLAQAQRTAELACQPGVAAFNASGRAYVGFALANPALFRLMFTTKAAVEPLGLMDSNSDPALELLQEHAAALVGARDSEEAKLLAMQSWALVHGLSMLLLDKQIRCDEEQIARVIDAANLLPRSCQQ